ncbi:inducible metalloproteinase inhibitor protein-like [Phlebotomus argentipes]|uniref:inducible metalloproteinase inhibitor protein-like n=1 Tax=Phlebotomus argentipes TaxID=94469 RepID=UPI00289350B4|nr:inducible metalloproteinase inhibitor protein-like [Phlebotomus argentipes]
MKTFVIFIFFTVFVAGAFAIRYYPFCAGENEVFSCGSSCYDYCDRRQCDIVNIMCQNRCRCADGYLRANDDSKCVPSNECPAIEGACGENEEYSCGSSCYDYCDERQCEIMNIKCQDRCRCAKGYVRSNDDTKCVLIEECPAIEEVCGENEEYSCGSSCYDYCDGRQCEIMNIMCQNRCRCAKGYVRSNDDTKCVLAEECTK